MAVLAIDFDKTIAQASEDPFQTGGEKPKQDTIDEIKELKENGHHTIVVWTARPWDHARHIAGLCTLWGVPFNGIMCEKGGADAYVDDKAVNQYDDDWPDQVEAIAEKVYE